MRAIILRNHFNFPKQISKNVEIVSFCLGGLFQKTLQKSLHVLRHHIFKQFPVSSRLCAGFKQYHVENSIRLPNTSVNVYNSFPTIDVVTSGTTDESVISTKPVKVSSGYEAVTSTCTLHDEEICAKLNKNTPPRLAGRSDEERNTCSKKWEIRLDEVGEAKDRRDEVLRLDAEAISEDLEIKA